MAFAAPAVIVVAGGGGLFALAVWLFVRDQHWLGIAGRWLGTAAGALVLGALAGFARESVRELRFRIDPVAVQKRALPPEVV